MTRSWEEQLEDHTIRRSLQRFAETESHQLSRELDVASALLLNALQGINPNFVAVVDDQRHPSRLGLLVLETARSGLATVQNSEHFRDFAANRAEQAVEDFLGARQAMGEAGRDPKPEGGQS